MLKLILKELKIYMYYFLLLMPVMTLYWYLKRDSKHFFIVVFVQVMIMFVLTLIPFLTNEQEEDANNGYDILSILPLKKTEIVGAKFITPLIAVLVLVIINKGIFSFYQADKVFFDISDSVVLIISLLSLILIGIIYISISFLGYEKFLVISSILTITAAVSPLILAGIVKPDVGKLVDRFVDLLKVLDGALFALSGLFLYFLLFFFAVKIERKK